MADEQMVFTVESPRLQPVLSSGSGPSLTVWPKQLFYSSNLDQPNYNQFLAMPWRCNVARNGSDSLSITLRAVIFNSWNDYSKFKFIHFIPHNANTEGTSVMDITNNKFYHNNMPYTFKIEEKFLVDKNDPNKYAFDLILSTSMTIPPHLTADARPPVPEKKEPSAVNKSFKEMFPEMYQDMLKLLNDPGSVNVAFIFTIHNCQRKVALWANRTLLDKHPRFKELFGTEDKSTALIPIEGISLTTFCILLKYLYTQDIDLSVDPSQYLMCDMDQFKDERSMDSLSSTEVLNKALKEHNAAQFYATWNVKDKVTWSDLFLAADRFEISKLRKQCLDNLLASVDEDNAMEILFGVGMCFKEEIRDPIMEYIADRLESDFSLKTRDPFKRFADHKGCHEVMLELMRLQSRSKTQSCG